MNVLLSLQSAIGIGIEVLVILMTIILVILGIRQGFLKSMLNTISNFFILVGSVLLAKPVATLCQKWFGLISFFGRQTGKIVAGMNDGIFAKSFGSFPAETVRADVISSIEGSGLFGPLRRFMTNIFNNTSVLDPTASVASLTGQALGAIVTAIICGIMLFVLLKLLILILKKCFDKLTTSSRLIGTTDKVFGAIFGVVKSGLYVVAYSAVLVMLTFIPTVNQFVTPIIQQHTVVTRFVYNQTETLVEKYVINNIAEWVNSAWQNRG